MSFGYSIGDVITVTALAWKTVQNARKACGEYDELTREVLSLHIVLRRLEQEVEKPENPINDVKSGDTYKEELGDVFDGCKRILNILDQVLTKYNALSEQERSGRKLWQQIRSGNGKMTDLAEMRGKLTYYTSAMSLFLNMVSVGTIGRVERQMNNAGGDLEEIKVAVNSITAQLMSKSTRHEGSILTAYAGDDRAVWKEFRRELLEDGFSSSVIRKHKGLIKAYIEELGSRGLLDEEDPNDEAEESPHRDVKPPIEGATAHDSKTQSESEASTRPKAEAESLVCPEPPLDFNTNPQVATHSKAESGHKGGPLQDPSPRNGSEPEGPQKELRWIWLSDENNGKNQQALAKEIGRPKVEHGSGSTAMEEDPDRTTDAGEEPEDNSRPAREDDGADNKAGEWRGFSFPFRRGRVAFTWDTKTPHLQRPFTNRSFHKTWHIVHDGLAPRCIEKISLSIPPNIPTSPESRAALYSEIAQAESMLSPSKTPEDLIVPKKELMRDFRSMVEAIERFPKPIERAGFSQLSFEDARSKGEGHRVVFHNWANGVTVTSGRRCSLCHPS